MILILSEQPNNKIGFLRLLTPLSHSLPTNVWGYVPRGTIIIVWVKHCLEINITTPETEMYPSSTVISDRGCDTTTPLGHESMGESSTRNWGQGQGRSVCGVISGNQGCGGKGGRFNLPSYTSSIWNFRGEVDGLGAVLETMDDQREAKD